MPTRRLFDEDPHLCEFEALVIAIRPEGPWIALDATAFFYEDGGQRADRGTLGGLDVVDLEIDESHTIWHRLGDGEAPRIGERVTGHVDPSRRRDHRQQHTGQHILSRVISERLGAKTRGFHMGEETSTVDIDLSELTAAASREVEMRANQVIFDDLEVRTRVESRPDDLPLRIVMIDGLEEQACCGTHVKRTGEAGPVKILKWEKAKGMVRVHFVCGERAVRFHRDLLESADAAARLFSCGWLDLPKAAAAAVDAARESERQAREWRARWARLEGERLSAARGRDAEGLLRVAAWLEGGDAETLREAANAILEAGRAIVILGGTGSEGKRPCLVARSEDLHGTGEFDARKILSEVIGPLGGRGGGTREFAQGACAAEEESMRRRIDGLNAPI